LISVKAFCVNVNINKLLFQVNIQFIERTTLSLYANSKPMSTQLYQVSGTTARAMAAVVTLATYIYFHVDNKTW